MYWCHQASSLSQGQEEDVLRLAESLTNAKQYHRAAHMLKTSQLQTKSWKGCFLTVNALFLAKNVEEAAKILETTETLVEKSVIDKAKSEKSPNCEWLVALLVLKGKVLEALDNRTQASEFFSEALKVDPYCQEALHALTKHQMLSADKEQKLIEAIVFDNDDDQELLKFIYTIGLKKYNKPQDLIVPKPLEHTMKNNLCLQVALAERHFYNCDYLACHQISVAVMKKDPFHDIALPIHISCLVELKKSNDLFLLAHRLVELYPEWAVAWFAVGSYYFLIGKQETARRYLSRATQLDRVFGPAWLAYGHSFALENEHDQAIAAYFKAYQLMPGCHLPLLYIGVEYGLTNNVKLAEKFFSESLQIAPEDPFVLHELGMTCFQNGDFETAEKHMLKALKQVQSVKQSTFSSQWESLLNNLGHTARKLGKLEKALDYHQQALVLKPMTSSTYSAIGFVQSLMKNYFDAVESFHRALSLKRDDAFSTTMLNNVVEHLKDEIVPFEGKLILFAITRSF